MSQESKIDPAIIKKTQDTLGRLIQAPSLTDKLLNRPPVQFIQDIVKSVIKNTGFMKGLYSQEELEASYIKSSKENKILFLNKLIIAVAVAVGEQSNAKANKIAAGVESEKTNELFQALAKAINIKPDNDEVVKKTLKKLKALDSSDDKQEKEEKKEKSRDKARDEEKESRDKAKSKHEESGKSRDREKDRERKERGDKDKDRERDREREREKDRDRKDKDKDREKDRERKDRGDKDKDRERHKDKERKERDHEKDREQSKDKDRHRDKEREKGKERDKERDRERDREARKGDKESRKTEERSRHRRDSNEEGNKENHRSERADEELSSRKNEDDSEESANRRRPSSARGPRVQIERDENYALKSQAETFEDNRNIGRPTTARPGAPRPKLNNESNETPVKVGSAAKKSTVIVHDDSDSDGDFVVKENKFLEDDNKNWKGLDEFRKPGEEDEDEKHGALVTKILESKGKLEHGNELHKTTDQQKPTIQVDLQRKKERERTQKEIDKLKESIQTLTKASIPLGRTLDFLQEDIDMMQKEIIKWSDEYDNNCRVLKRQQAEMQNFIDPYKEALRQIENQISEQMDRIGTVKRNILLNEEKISRLIFNVGKS